MITAPAAMLAINPSLEFQLPFPLLEPEPEFDPESKLDPESEPRLLEPEGVGGDTDEVDGTKDEVHWFASMM